MNGPERPHLRLLPWARPDGAPCYVVGDDDGPVSRVADQVEAVQLGMASELTDHARYLLDGPAPGSSELRFLTECLVRTLDDVVRIAESRGRRLHERAK